jgi:hypothetical protein
MATIQSPLVLAVMVQHQVLVLALVVLKVEILHLMDGLQSVVELDILMEHFLQILLMMVVLEVDVNIIVQG